MKKEDFKKLILKSVTSTEEYKANIKPIYEEIVRQNKETTKIYLDTVLNILTDKKAAPTSKYCALFSLKSTTEGSIPALVADLFSRTSALKSLQEQAAFDKDKKLPERGAKFFSSKPTEIEQSTGKNFLALLLEVIKYWDMKYGSSDKGKDNVPRALYKNLAESQKVPFAEKFQYYKIPQQGDSQPQQTSQSSGANQQGANQQGGNQQDAKKPATGQLKESDMLKLFKEKVNYIKNIKATLRQAYEQNNDPIETESLKYYYSELDEADKKMVEHVETFFNNPANNNPENEALLNDILLQNEQADALCAEFEKYVEGAFTWQEHLAFVLQILKGNEKSTTPDTTPLDDVAVQKLQHPEQQGGQGKKGGSAEAERKAKVEEEKANYQQNKVVADTAEAKSKNVSENFDNTSLLFMEARKKPARIVRNNASDLYEDADDDISKENSKQRNVENKSQVGEPVAMPLTNSQLRPAQEPEKRSESKEQAVVEMDHTQQLFIMARKLRAPIVRINASDLYEDADDADDTVSKKESISKGSNEKTAQAGINKVEGPKDQKNREVTDTKSQFVPAKDEQKHIEIKAQAVVETDLTQQMLTEARKVPDPIEEKKFKEQKDKVKQEERLRTEEVEKKQREKEAGEQKVKEEIEANRIKSEKAQEEQRSKDEQARMEKAKDDEKKSKGTKADIKSATTETSGTKLAARAHISQGKEVKSEAAIIEETKTINKNPTALSKPLAQSVFVKAEENNVIQQGSENQRASRGMVQSFRLDKSTVAERFVTELKMMENSIKVARDRSAEMESIKAGISQSFTNRNRKPPNYKEIVDKSLIKSLEVHLEKLKTEKENLPNENKEMRSVSPEQKQKQDASENNALKRGHAGEPKGAGRTAAESEWQEQTVNLQKQCEEYQQEIGKVTQENEALKTELKQVQAKVQEVDTQPALKQETETLKKTNDELIEKVKAIEDQLNNFQQLKNENQSKDEEVEVVKKENRELIDKVKAIEEESRKFQEQLKIAGNEGEEVKTLRKQNIELTEELGKLEQQLKGVQQEKASAANIQEGEPVKALKQENDELISRVKALEDQLSNQQQSSTAKADQNGEAETLRNKNKLLANEVKALNTHINELEELLKAEAKEKEAVNELKKDNYVLANSVRELDAKLQDLQQSSVKNQHESKEVVAIQNENRELVEKVRVLEAQYKQLEQVIETTKGESEDVKLLKNANRQLKDKVAELEDQLRILQQALNVDANEYEPVQILKANNQEMISHIEALEEEIKSLEQQVHTKQSVNVNGVQEFNDKLKNISEENKELKINLEAIRTENEKLHRRVKEIEEANNSGHQQQNHVENHQTRPVGTTWKTEYPVTQPKPLTNDPQDDDGNVFIVKSKEDLFNANQNRNIFGRTREIMMMTGNEDFLLEIIEPRWSPYNGDSRKGNKQELYLGANPTIHNTGLESPPRLYANRRTEYASPTAQKTELMGRGNEFKQHHTRSPEGGYFTSPDNMSREDYRTDRPYSRSVAESEHEQDVLNIKGDEVISDVYVLKELKLRLDIAGLGNSLQQFKIACLKPKSVLFENDVLQVGLTANLIQDYATSKNLLKLIIYYGNKLDEDIREFRVSAGEGLNLNVNVKPQTVESVIASNKQVKQQYLISFTSVPFSSLELSCEGLFAGKYANFSIPVPNLLVKFMDFKFIELAEFRYRWKNLESDVLKSEPIVLDGGLVKSAYDFKKYFGYLIDLKAIDEYETGQESKGMKFGGLFEVDVPNVEYMLKINILPTSEVVFQIATQRQNASIARYLLQTLVFIFRR